MLMQTEFLLYHLTSQYLLGCISIRIPSGSLTMVILATIKLLFGCFLLLYTLLSCLIQPDPLVT